MGSLDTQSDTPSSGIAFKGWCTKDMAMVRCPRCDGQPVTIDRVTAPVTANFGDALAEQPIVERATCANGHRWFERDEPKSGDVVMWRLGETAVYAFAIVLDDGIVPPVAERQTGTKAEAEAFAAGAVAETEGAIRELDRDEPQRPTE